MKKEYVKYLCCIDCKGKLVLKEEKIFNKRIQNGLLVCKHCSKTYPVFNFIPRFSRSKGYASSFGTQWKTFAKAQIDIGKNQESSIRFKSEVGWSADEISNSLALEVGCGAGRFVDVVSKFGAKLIIGVDITDAVDAAYKNLGSRDNVFIIQADIYNMPFREQTFNFVYSIGVIHHTPEPKVAFDNMLIPLKNKGKIALSVYEISLYDRPNRNSLNIATKDLLWSLNLWRCELFRTITTKLPHVAMVVYCKTFVPILHYLNKIPLLRFFRYFFPSTCYRNLPVAWSMLDTMDTYSTKIVHQYRAKDIFQWFLGNGLKRIILMNSRAGWVSITADKGDEKSRTRLKVVYPKPVDVGS